MNIKEIVNPSVKEQSADLADRYQQITGCSRYESRKQLWLEILKGNLILESDRSITTVGKAEEQ